MRDTPDGDVLSVDGVSTNAAPTGNTAPVAGFVVATIVVVLDQLTKWWAEARLETGPCSAETCVDVVGPLRFHLSYNTGVSFGMGDGSGLGWLIGPIALGVAAWLLVVARRSTPRLAGLLGVVAGGAIGNVIDRVVRAEDGFLTGGVVDFIDFQFFPIFNVADIAVVGGALALMAAPWLLGDDAAGLGAVVGERTDDDGADSDDGAHDDRGVGDDA